MLPSSNGGGVSQHFEKNCGFSYKWLISRLEQGDPGGGEEVQGQPGRPRQHGEQLRQHHQQNYSKSTIIT